LVYNGAEAMVRLRFSAADDDHWVHAVVDSGSVYGMFANQHCRTVSCPDAQQYGAYHDIGASQDDKKMGFGSQEDMYHWVTEGMHMGDLHLPRYTFGSVDRIVKKMSDAGSYHVLGMASMLSEDGKSLWAQMPSTMEPVWSIDFRRETLTLGSVDPSVPLTVPLIKSASSSVDFYTVAGRIYVNGQEHLNNHTPWTCIIDTGYTTSVFPTSMKTHLGSTVSISLGDDANPVTILHKLTTDTCSFMDQGSTIILGNTWMRGRVLNFDRKRRRIGISQVQP
jgi:hypothetical protein